MAFWSKKPEAPAAAEPAAGSDPTLATVMDLAAGMLRDYGRTAIAVEQVAAETLQEWCENWAQHLLVGAPRPGEDGKPAPVEKRDWAGARRFFAERRREETAFLARSLGALQTTVWSFVQTLDGMLTHDDDSDGRLRKELAKLKQVAQEGSVELLRQEVLGSVEEIGKLAQARHQELRQRVDGLSTQVRTLGSELEVARQEGATDGLTRVFNRKAFDDRLAQAVSMGRLFGQKSSLILLDIDHFKKVNDTLGHQAGDAVLRDVADCLVRAFLLKSELVARYGGEEFAVLLWDTPLAKAKAAAEKVLQNLRNGRIVHDGQLVTVTASLGVAELAPGETAAAWVERTDRALYAAKHGGRNRVCVDPAEQAKQ